MKHFILSVCVAALGAVSFAVNAEDQCAACDGKIDTMTLRYQGFGVASVTVLTRKGVELFSGIVSPFQSRFTLNGSDNLRDRKGTLGPAIYFYVDGIEIGMLHTSCSVPIGPGTIVGDFVVEFATSRNNGPTCPVDGGGPGGG